MNFPPRRQKIALITLPIAGGVMLAAWILLPERYFFIFLISVCVLVTAWEWFVRSRKKQDAD